MTAYLQILKNKSTSSGQAQPCTWGEVTLLFPLSQRYKPYIRIFKQKAQADIDQIALGRLPTPDDYESLPYVKAIIKEIARWGPVSPLGLPHRVAEDDVYENYLIPKGATVFGNIWAIAHDDEVYPDPFTFDPSRHLGDKPQLDPLKFIFGFGRRVCPGAHLAEMTLFLNIATLLTVFNISKPVDGEGNEVEPKIGWVNGTTSYLKPFE
jgi:cytochrome P450